MKAQKIAFKTILFIFTLFLLVVGKYFNTTPFQIADITGPKTEMIYFFKVSSIPKDTQKHDTAVKLR
jgi:hypothetical protein